MITFAQTTSMKDNHDVGDAQICSNINPNTGTDCVINLEPLSSVNKLMSLLDMGTLLHAYCFI